MRQHWLDRTTYDTTFALPIIHVNWGKVGVVKEVQHKKNYLQDWGPDFETRYQHQGHLMTNLMTVQTLQNEGLPCVRLDIDSSSRVFGHYSPSTGGPNVRYLGCLAPTL